MRKTQHIVFFEKQNHIYCVDNNILLLFDPFVNYFTPFSKIFFKKFLVLHGLQWFWAPLANDLRTVTKLEK